MNKPKFLLSALILLFLFQINSHSQTGSNSFKSEFYNYPINAKLGMCDGYHLFWMVLSKASSRPEDMIFSINVSKELKARVGQNKEFSEYSLETLKALNGAMASGNALLVKQFAGVCHELGYPVGQNTKR
jgi:hypothetical protein